MRRADGCMLVIEALIRWSLANRVLVLLLAAILALAGLYAMRTVPLDAIPDLTDVQVTIRVSLPGQAPQVVEDQVTYPLSTAMLAVPGAVAVRGYRSAEHTSELQSLIRIPYAVFCLKKKSNLSTNN